MGPLRVWYRPVCLGLTAGLLGFWVYEVWYAFTYAGWGDAFGDDLAVLTEATARLFSGGSWYQPWQLEGPYPAGGNLVLYPPVTAFFFAPFVVLGNAAFLAGAVVILTGLVIAWRPAPWAWPLIALCLLVPTTTLKAWSGNPSMWVAVAVGLGLRWGWPGALVLLKVTFLPFALIGIRHRGWWITALGLVILSGFFWEETLAYPQVLLDIEGPTFLYSVWDWPVALIPVIAWLAVRRDDHDAIGTRAAALRARLRPAAASATTGPATSASRTRR